MVGGPHQPLLLSESRSFQAFGASGAFGANQTAEDAWAAAFVVVSMDWFKGKFTGNPWFLPSNMGVSG